jgi:hypothetical protein
VREGKVQEAASLLTQAANAPDAEQMLQTMDDVQQQLQQDAQQDEQQVQEQQLSRALAKAIASTRARVKAGEGDADQPASTQNQEIDHGKRGEKDFDDPDQQALAEDDEDDEQEDDQAQEQQEARARILSAVSKRLAKTKK